MTTLLTFLLIMIAVVLGTVFIAVPVFRGIGMIIGGFFRGIGWLVSHVFEFITGMVQDAVRFVGTIVAFVVLMPFLLLNIVIGRWSAAGHFFRSMRRECQIASSCLYRIALQRPLRFLLLGGLLEGIEERFEEAVASTPPADKPGSRTGQFPGYAIVGSLPMGGSGAKLYIAEPTRELRAERGNMPERCVIKSFAISDGSTLPQIVRESRALEAAKQLGLVLDHGMDEHRFFYVMPYHDGDHLSIVARQLHGESDGSGLARRELEKATGYVEDLLLTLREYHRAGLWHKDVKPENIIVHDGRAHLVDLGLVTPLRSAMTLTTHGTEYFRDPEMVRQALRGVKVHQVDGTKFDIYAVGAVTYFLLENEFPAHGGLSRFARKSPESLRWIVRRAMTDYNKRYANVDLMLADIRHVMGSENPFTMKPAELPSMRDGEAREHAGLEAEDIAAAAVHDAQARAATIVEANAGSPQPKEENGVAGKGVAAGIGSRGPFMQVGKLHLDEEGNPVRNEGAGMGPRPKLRVTNWWTGAYVPEELMPTAEPEQPAVQAKAASPRPPGHVPFIPHGPRRPAREQIASAQARAASISKRAAARRATFTSRRQGTRHQQHEQRGPAAIMGLIVMFACIFGGLMLVRGVINENSFDGGIEYADAASANAGVLAGGLAGVPAPWPLIVVNDHPAKTNPEVKARIEAFMAERDDGWEFFTEDIDTEARVRSMLPTGPMEDFTHYNRGPLNELLSEIGALGILHISAEKGDLPPEDRVRVTFLMAQEGDLGRPLFVRAGALPVTPEAVAPPTHHVVPTAN